MSELEIPASTVKFDYRMRTVKDHDKIYDLDHRSTLLRWVARHIDEWGGILSGLPSL